MDLVSTRSTLEHTDLLGGCQLARRIHRTQDCQRIINGGGKIVREYGLGRGALDLVVERQGQRHAIEVKLRRDTTTEERALLDQVAGYLDRLGLGEGWLVMFDLRKELPWSDKLFMREVEHAGRKIRIVGC